MAENDVIVKIKVEGAEKAKKDLSLMEKMLRDFSKSAMKGMGIGQVAAGTAIGNLFVEGIKTGLSTIGSVVQAAFNTASNFVMSSFDAYVKFEDQLFSVKKTVGFTKEEMKAFGDELLIVSRSTRTATEDLANIATVGGQLGIDKDQIIGFTQAIDTLNVALGDEFQGGAEEITTVVGRMADQLDDIGGKDVTENILRIGNALNVLGVEGSATGGSIADMVQRMTASSKLVKVPTANLLGMSTVLQEAGINTERAGTAMSELFKRVPKQANEIAAALSKINPAFDGEEFKYQVDHNFMAALEMMAQAITEGELSASEAAIALDEMGFSGGYVTDVLMTLGQNMDKVHEKTALAGEALQGTDSIIAEFTDRNSSAAAKMEMLNKRFDEAKLYFIEPFVNGLVQIADQMQPFIDEQLPKLKNYIETVLTPKVQEFVDKFITHWPEIKRVIEQEILPAAQKFATWLIEATPKIVNAAKSVWRIFNDIYSILVLLDNTAQSVSKNLGDFGGRLTSALGKVKDFQNGLVGIDSTTSSFNPSFTGNLGLKNAYANGGIVGRAANGMMVGGNSYSGDKLLARVNSGEMILNKEQQAALFNIIKNAQGNTTNNNFNGDISFGGQMSGMQQMNVFNQLLMNI